MNTKTVEELREEYNAESPIPVIENITMYINWLEQKLLTPSPERGKEGKTVDKINKELLDSLKEMVLYIHLYQCGMSADIEPNFPQFKKAVELIRKSEKK